MTQIATQMNGSTYSVANIHVNQQYLNLPNSPCVGQLHYDNHGTTWTFDGVHWITSSIGSTGAAYGGSTTQVYSSTSMDNMTSYNINQILTELSDIRRMLAEDVLLREKYPSVKLAWEQYQMTKVLAAK